ncbi:phage tail tape measure protein [Streptomyces sp. NPDC047968]|uniref:phage tail tape measure protein n=3 Tax=Streptomyces TaxID=1883 RepID=UPI0034414FD6
MSQYTLSVSMRADATRLVSELRQSSRAVRGFGLDVAALNRQLGRLPGSARGAVGGLRDLDRQTTRTRLGLRRMGGDGRTSMRHITDGTRQARREMHHLQRLVVGGGIVGGLAEIAKEGNEYQRAIQKWGAVTEASGVEMVQAAAKARELGSDLNIPGTSAAKAADAMVELAKAGQTSTSSIANARAAMQLAAADNLSAADAAKFLGDIMDQFGLSSNNAGRAADVLAASANAASGGLMDIYYAMSYTGPVATQLGIGIEDTSAAVAMLARSGILGSKAGTSLRGMLTNLARPTSRMQQGLKDLGIEAWDAQGNFKGLRNVIEGFEKAQHRMSQKDFLGALANVVGKPALAGAAALAHQGTEAFDQMHTAISRTGAAGEIAASQTKGLAGAVTQLKSQAKTTGQALYTSAAPGLEWFTRLLTSGLAGATPVLSGTLDYLHDLYTLAGPSLSAAARGGVEELAGAFGDLGGELKGVAFDVAAAALNVLANAGDALVDILRNAYRAVSPVTDALAGLNDEADAGGSALDIIVTGLNLASQAASTASGALVPVGEAVAWLVRGFSELPGPVQTAIVSMLLARRVAPVFDRLGRTVSGPVVHAYRSLGDQMRVQQQLAAAQGQSIGRVSAAMAVLQTRVPVIGQMTAAFRNANGPVAGLTRSIGVGLGGAARGLMGVLGGPWGVVLAGAGLGLSMLADRQQKAAQAAKEHEARISNLTQALRESNGAIDDSVRAAAAQQLMETKVFDGKERLVDVMRKAGISVRQVTDAYVGQDSSLNALQKQLEATAEANMRWGGNQGGAYKYYTDTGLAAARAADALGSVKGEMSKAVQDAKDLADATGTSGRAAQSATGPFGTFSDAMRRLSDETADADSRARALHDALNVLAGGSINLSAAEARLNRSVSDVSDTLKNGVDKADGYGKTLLNMDGSLSTVTRNGQKLYDLFQGLSTNAADAALAAYQYAEANGKSVPEALAAAQAQMKTARDAALKAADGFDIGAEAAAKLADDAGLVPEQVSILLQTVGMDESVAELIAVQQALQATPDKRTVTIATLSNEARKDLEDLGFKIEDLKDRQVKVSAPTDMPRQDLDALIQKIAQTPGSKHVKVTSATQETVASLEAVKEKIAGVPGGKTVRVSAPTADARKQLEDLGFKIAEVPGSKDVTVTVPTGSATTNVARIQGAINGIYGRTIGIGVSLRATAWDRDGNGVPDAIQARARGAVVDYFADGGVRESHVAEIAPAGSWRVWAEPETGGEAYVPLSPSKRTRSKAIVGEVVRRFGGDVSWYADGGLTGFSYTPASYTSISSLVSEAQDKKGNFSLSLFEKKLKSSARTMSRWRRDLATVAARAGTDVARALEEMGEDGVAMTRKMATGSSKYVRQMSGELKALADASRASLTDYTSQLKSAVKDQAAFERDLAKLAASGYGDLASRLAAQGDQDAADLASQAARDDRKARAANDAAKAADATLTGEQLANLVKIIAATKSSSIGIHAVADATGLGEDDIITVASKARSQIQQALGSRASRLLSDLAKATKGLAYADGGIWEPGVYSSARGLIKFAEPSTRGESYIPHAASKRGRATAVLAETADRFGYALTGMRDASAGRVRVVVVRQPAALVGSMPVTVTGASSSPEEFGAAVMRRLRNAQRGGLL